MHIFQAYFLIGGYSSFDLYILNIFKLYIKTQKRFYSLARLTPPKNI